MSVTSTITLLPFPAGIDNSQRLTHVRGTFVLTGSYVAGGFTLAWIRESLKTQGVYVNPVSVVAYSTTGSGFVYVYNTSTNLMQIFTTGTASGDALNELSAGTLPSGVTGDTIGFIADFVRSYS